MNYTIQDFVISLFGYVVYIFIVGVPSGVELNSFTFLLGYLFWSLLFALGMYMGKIIFKV